MNNQKKNDDYIEFEEYYDNKDNDNIYEKQFATAAELNKNNKNKQDQSEDQELEQEEYIYQNKEDEYEDNIDQDRDDMENDFELVKSLNDQQLLWHLTYLQCMNHEMDTNQNNHHQVDVLL